MKELDRQDAIRIVELMEQLATASTLGALHQSALEPIGRAVGVYDAESIGDELDRLAQRLRDLTE